VDINAKIKIATIFQDGKIIPKWFVWESRKYEIKKVNYVWNDHQGREEIIRFSVSDGANSYELAYNSFMMTWRLQKIL